VITLIEEACIAGARLTRACKVVGLSPRTVQRYREDGQIADADADADADALMLIGNCFCGADADRKLLLRGSRLRRCEPPLPRRFGTKKRPVFLIKEWDRPLSIKNPANKAKTA